MSPKTALKELAIGTGYYLGYYAAHTLGHIIPIYLLSASGAEATSGQKNPDIQFSLNISPITVIPHFKNPYYNLADNLGGIMCSAAAIYGLSKLHAYYKKNQLSKDTEKKPSFGFHLATAMHTLDMLHCAYKTLYYARGYKLFVLP